MSTTTTSKVSADPVIAEQQTEEDPTTKDFQQKYYPVSATSINKYDPYSLAAAIDEEILKVSLL